MTDGRIPLGLVAHRRLGPQTDFRFAPFLRWARLNDTEYHLSAHHLALAARAEDGTLRLGAILDPSYPAAPQIDGAGRWRLGYQPIALRTWPFVLGAATSDRPVDGLEVLPGSTRIATEGAPICIEPATGALGPEMNAIRNTLLMLREGGERLGRALELLRIANVLVPLRGADGAASEFLTVDAGRFNALEPMALAALARESFLALDLAGAMLFSRRHLDAKRMPVPEKAPVEAAETPATRADPMDFVLAGLEAMNFALDASDLFDPRDPAIDWREFAPPPPPDLGNEATHGAQPP
ncbi:SapC family protein [Aureimonas leprariae]|uniref:SapC family protein n=1 Tax=Plantimonas leprariae TaxID=2615207 RepID=A0A7V7PN80_9HYPH|nr:SapC family protein [Aureimonas leprariae]KAB0679035.1 SapC family protein [Aureimonas leprariae]